MQRVARILSAVLVLALALAGCSGRQGGDRPDLSLVRNGNVVYVTYRGASVQTVAVSQDFKPFKEVEQYRATTGVGELCVFGNIGNEYIHGVVITSASVEQPENPFTHPEEVFRGKTDMYGVEVPFSIERSHDKLMVVFLIVYAPLHHLAVAYQESPMDPKNPDPARFPPMDEPLSPEFIERLVAKAKSAFMVDARALREHWVPVKPQV